MKRRDNSGLRNSRFSGMAARSAATLAVLAMLSSCAGVDTKPEAGTSGKLSVTPVPQTTIASEEPKSEKTDSQKRTVYEYSGSDRFVAAYGGQPPVVRLGDGKVQVNFRDAPILEVVQVILGDMLKVPFTIEGEIEGNITLSTSSPVSEDALISLLESLLANRGVVMVRSEDGIYRLGPADALRSDAPIRVGRAATDASGYDTRIVPLKYISVREAQKILKPLGADKSVLLADPVRNLLMLAAPGPQMNNIVRTLDMFDVDVFKGMSFGIYEIFNTDAATVVERFNGLIGSEEVSPIAGLVKLVPLDEINSVLVITPRSHYLETVKTWIERLDQLDVSSKEGGASKRLYVYNVRNGEAIELANLLNQMFGGAPVVSQTRAPKKPSTMGGVAPGKETAAAGQKETPAVPASFPASGDVEGVPRIVPDEVNNSLLVMAEPAVWREIQSVLGKLDVMPAQVLVEVSIWEVTLDDELKYGVEWFFEHSNSNVQGIGTLDLAGEGIAPTVPGFSYLLSDRGGDWRAVINALDQASRIEVLSSPSVLVLDNQTAQITVGDQQPILAGTSTTDGGTITENIQYKDTGVKLSVTPRVNDGGLVVMEIEQEVTDVGTIDEATGQRSFLQRAITSKVAIQSGDTIILGGLIQRNQSEGKSGVPVLHRLPLIGSLFGSTSDETRRTELLVTISPRAVTEYNDFIKIGDEFRTKMSAVTEAFGL